MNDQPFALPDFDAMYREHSDPWGYETSTYEAAKYDATLSALPHRHFRSAFEAGCSIGVLTARLAARCDAVLGLDGSALALCRARGRNRGNPRIRFQHGRIPRDWPDRRFDLVVLSEVLYYLTDAEIAHTVQRCRDTLAPDGVLVMVNWLGSTGAVQTGDAAADLFMRQARSFLFAADRRRTASYRIDVLHQ